MGGVQSKKLSKKLEVNEAEKITLLFNDISSVVKKVRIVDKDGFKRFHLIPSPLGDRLFSLFDTKKTGMITLDDFMQSMTVCGKAPDKEKAALIYRFLDVDDDDIITRDDLQVLSVITLEEQVDVPLRESTQSFSSSTSKVEDPIVQQLIDMGFSKLKVNQALKATENGTKGQGSQVEVITSWILQNQTKEDEIDIDVEPASAQPQLATESPKNGKPDPRTMDTLTARLAVTSIISTFETLYDIIDKEKTGKITMKQFKKWTQATKRPHEMDAILKPMTGLFFRALTYSMDSFRLKDEKSHSFERTDTSPEVNPKEVKRMSSLASIETLTGKLMARKDDKKESSSKSKKDKKEDAKHHQQVQQQQNAAAADTQAKREDTLAPMDTSSGKHSHVASSAGSLDSSFDHFTDSDEDHSVKPAIQVVIREKPIEPTMVREPSLLNFDSTPGIVRPHEKSMTIRSRGTRPSSKPIQDSVGDIFFASPVQTTLTPSSSSTSIYTSPGPNQTSQDPTAITSPLSPSKANQPPGLDAMRQCIQYLEQGQFKQSKVYLDQCIQQMVKSSSSNTQAIQKDIVFCMGYRVALGILDKIATLERQLTMNSVDSIKKITDYICLLSRFLVGIPLQQQHRMVCARMAIRYNFDSRNYGVAAKLLEVVRGQQQQQLLATEERAKYERQLATCKQQQCRNESLPMYICPQCKSTNSLNDSQLTGCPCGRPVRLCSSTQEVIKDLSYLKCHFCNTTHSINQTEVIPSSECHVCSAGRIDVHS
ncbi:hypothetical protein SAMD00019534_040290 [Acytostelium subglobosum LB1]|uniref:hypothetical protein n=1 Tax=Acytostelium subglobosum LB1 TaxID=1410327 RepID=UPI000644DFC0|nr:hypothetical protein SAMD00019534_040290 [Acytostelium subglobosum LB1]GAM20854.1 hypothetical protein SAMD00019534_040290 [Acytostelium subglobosum LB1]|eukprot:XP_012755988.1 hypothetical protein SAMD00019534_040290 [Acytostelium subglobosum LB1]